MSVSIRAPDDSGLDLCAQVSQRSVVSGGGSTLWRRADRPDYAALKTGTRLKAGQRSKHTSGRTRLPTEDDHTTGSIDMISVPYTRKLHSVR